MICQAEIEVGAQKTKGVCTSLINLSRVKSCTAHVDSEMTSTSGYVSSGHDAMATKRISDHDMRLALGISGISCTDSLVQ